jgi:NADH-quinone oxidoreductase subunit J
MGSPLVFILLALIAIASALGMLVSRNAVHSALFLVLNFTTVGVFYLVLNAPFIAMVQITVYAGAIMVLFLFVIMLLGAEKLESAVGTEGSWQRPLAGVLALGLVASFGLALLDKGSAEGAQPLPSGFANPEAIGLALFDRYIFPFEVTAVLLLVAMISLVVWRGQRKKG